MQNIKIAIIDNGVADDLLRNPLEYKVYINCENYCVIDCDSMEHSGFLHGTICALILKENFPECSISSVKILNDNGVGNVEKLKPALEWCYQNSIFLVNLSLGTIHFQEQFIMREVINHYANKGMIIVAAASNNGFRTYPASFSNVIGVTAGDNLARDNHLYIHMGIDYVAPSEHEVTLEDISIKLGKSNSYAAPFVTALIGTLETNAENYSVCSLRNALLSSHKKIFSPYVPDWIETAWISSKIRSSNAVYYFKEIEGSYDDCISKVDTVVMYDRDEFSNYGAVEKNIVYLGEEPIEYLGRNKHFWSREQRLCQIIMSEKRLEDIDIPVILFRLDAKQDEILWLSKLREYFWKDGYNAYTASRRVESVLYNLEYIPQELCNERSKEKLHDFLYWQTYYGQADLILFGIKEGEYSENVTEMTDMFVDVCRKGNSSDCTVTIYCDEKLERKQELKDMNEDELNTLYHHMLMLLTEEMDE